MAFDATRYCIIVAVVALVVRLLHLTLMLGSPFDHVLLGDAERYDAWGQSIAHGDVLGNAVFYQAPLYPYLLGATFTVFGHHLPAVRVLQALWGSLACALVFAAGYRVFGALAGVVAGLVLALYGPGLFFDFVIQKSSLDGFLVSLLLFVSVVPSTPASYRQPLGVGIVAALLALNRENALLLIPLAMCWYALVARRLSTVAVLLAGAAIVLLPVMIRNRVVGGEWVLTSSQAGTNLFIGNNANATGTYVPLVPGHGSVQFEQADARRLAEADRARFLSASQVSAYWRDRALAWVRDNPKDAFLLTLKKAALLMNRREAADTEDVDSHRQFSWVLNLSDSVVHFGILAPLAALGVFLTRRNARGVSLPYVFMIGYTASVLAFYVLDRYRYPLIPFLAFLAGAGVARVVDAWRRGARGELVPAFAFAGVIALLCNWPLAVLASERQQAATALNIGDVLERSGRDPEAVDQYRKAIALLPSFAEAHGKLAALLARSGSPDAAAHFENAIRLEPNIAETRGNYGMFLAQGGRLPEALNELKTAVQLDDRSAENHYNLATAYANGGQLYLAETEYRTALRLDPQKADAHNNLGSVLASQGRLDEAIEHFREAVRLQPTLEGARTNLERAERIRRQ